jgi:putative Mg2+ transporter-C (MgtC) family protein
MHVDEPTMILRILLAGVLGFLVGLERERHGRAAGLRTCIMVSLAGALLMSLSLYLSFIFEGEGGNSPYRLDAGRLPSYAIAGMGFLGAGAFIQGKSSARGVTTAAALWTCTGVGLAVGAGLYLPALATVTMVLAVLNLMRPLDRLIRHSQYVTLTVEAREVEARAAIRALLEEHKVNILFVGRERCIPEGGVTFIYSLVVHSGNQWSDMLEKLEKLPGVTCYSWAESRVP